MFCDFADKPCSIVCIYEYRASGRLNEQPVARATNSLLMVREKQRAREREKEIETQISKTTKDG